MRPCAYRCAPTLQTGNRRRGTVYARKVADSWASSTEPAAARSCRPRAFWGSVLLGSGPGASLDNLTPKPLAGPRCASRELARGSLLPSHPQRAQSGDPGTGQAGSTQGAAATLSAGSGKGFRTAAHARKHGASHSPSLPALARPRPPRAPGPPRAGTEAPGCPLQTARRSPGPRVLSRAVAERPLLALRKSVPGAGNWGRKGVLLLTVLPEDPPGGNQVQHDPGDDNSEKPNSRLLGSTCRLAAQGALLQKGAPAARVPQLNSLKM